jgi:hypothetical protein
MNRKREKVSAERIAAAKGELEAWLTERLRYNDVPRLKETKEWVSQVAKLPLKLKDIQDTMRLHPAYMLNMPQQLMAKGAQMYRPIVVNTLGTWHADIGYFAKTKRYRMPETYQHGYLVAKDVLSRRIYATPLLGSKDAKAIIKAFKVLFEEHQKALPGVPVLSISFDQERSVVGEKVQEFLLKSGIGFHAFHMSSSKAKCAEGAIRQIRTVMARLLKRNIKGDTWYNLLPVVVKILNSQEVCLDGKKLGYAPGNVNGFNVEDFKRRLFKSVPAYYWAQFDLAPGLVNFKYSVGTVVRAKLLATSSAVLGQKTSEINLTKEQFEILKEVPYVTRNMKVGRAYRCKNLNTGRIEVFQEDEITPGRDEEGEEPTIDAEADEYKRATRAVTQRSVV